MAYEYASRMDLTYCHSAIFSYKICLIDGKSLRRRNIEGIVDPANLIIKIHFIIIISLLSFLIVHDIYWKHKDRDQLVMELTLSSVGIITVGWLFAFMVMDKVDRTKQKILEYQHSHGDDHEKIENIT